MTNKISIIIPIYNVERYLPQCLGSIIDQTYQNLEIILINDGSTDSCSKICDDYREKDCRIKVIHRKNGGLSDARNAGMKIATGEYIAFVDSDDFISKNFCEILLTTALLKNAEIVECCFIKFEKELELKRTASPSENPEIFTTAAALELLMKEYFKQTVWNKIYHREVVKNLLFPVGKINEDEYWTYKVFGNAKKIVKMTNVLYFYRQQSESIMGRAYHISRLDGLLALEQRIQYMKQNFPALENLAIKIYCLGSLWHYAKIVKHSEIDQGRVYRNKIITNVKAYARLSVIKYWSLKEIFWFQFFLVSPEGYSKFRNYCNNGVLIKLSKLIKKVFA